MRTRRLGNSDLHVSEISLGSWLTYGLGVEADAARRCGHDHRLAGLRPDRVPHRHRHTAGDVQAPGLLPRHLLGATRDLLGRHRH